MNARNFTRPVLFWLLLLPFHAFSGEKDSLAPAKIDFSQVNTLQIKKYNPKAARSGKDGSQRLFVIKLFRGPNDGKNGKHGKPGFRLLVKVSSVPTGDSSLLKVAVTPDVPKNKKTDVYFVNPRYGHLIIFSNGGEGGDGGVGEDGCDQKDERSYPESGANGGNGGDGGPAGSFEVTFDSSAKEYENCPCIAFESTGGMPGWGGKGGDPGETRYNVPGVYAQRGNDGHPGNSGGLGFAPLIKQPVTKLDTLVLFDSSRQRSIPVAFYFPEGKPDGAGCSLVVLNHGYNENKPGSYLGYAYIGTKLAAKGYFVVSIQHELPTDSLIPMAGVPQVVRRPFWDRGADNMLFVIDYLKKAKPGLKFAHIALIGHSNGGDMAALFPQKYPGIVEKVITLDNRRMALPRTFVPRIYSLRSSDQPADAGVLPAEGELKEYKFTIIKLEDIRHNDMGSRATPDQQQEINDYLLKFLFERI